MSRERYTFAKEIVANRRKISNDLTIALKSKEIFFCRTQVRPIIAFSCLTLSHLRLWDLTDVILAWPALGLFVAKPNQVRVCTWAVTVVTWNCQSCKMDLSKLLYAICSRPYNDNKLVFDLHSLIGFWKELNKVQRLNALGPLCLWHCLYFWQLKHVVGLDM